MAESNAPKQDFAPPWLKFPPADSSKSAASKNASYQNERNRQRRDDPYYARTDYARLHRQNSFDFHEGKRFPPGQGKFRHHSVDDDYYNYPYNYGYYPPDYSYEKYSMQYSSQPSLARNGNRGGKFPQGRFSQMNGNHQVGFGGGYELFEPYYHHQGPRRGGHYERDYGRDHRDNRARDRGSERDRPFSDDFPSLVGNGESNGEVKTSKPGSGVWAEERKALDTPPKSNKNEESADLLKNTSPGIYKALIPSKNASKKPVRDPNVRMNGNTRDSSPLSPSNKPNFKENTRQSPTPDLAIVTQPKKLGDKKSEFLRALRNESSIRNGDTYQDQNQNAIEKKQLIEESPMIEDLDNYTHLNGNHTDVEEDGSNKVNGQVESTEQNGDKEGRNGENKVNGEKLISEVDHISLCGEDEEKRLLLSMGWDEEDNTEYVITEDEIREFQDLLRNHTNAQKNGLNSTLRSALNKKLENHFACNGLTGGHQQKEEKTCDKPL